MRTESRDIGAVTGTRSTVSAAWAGQHRVEAAAGVGELELEDDAVVVQLSLVDEHRQRQVGPLPGPRHRHLPEAFAAGCA